MRDRTGMVSSWKDGVPALPASVCRSSSYLADAPSSDLVLRALEAAETDEAAAWMDRLPEDAEALSLEDWQFQCQPVDLPPRAVDVRTVLEVAMGRVLPGGEVKERVGELVAFLGWMADRPFAPGDVAGANRVAVDVRDAICTQFPELQDVAPPPARPAAGSDVDAWLEQRAGELGRFFAVNTVSQLEVASERVEAQKLLVDAVLPGERAREIATVPSRPTRSSLRLGGWF
jgi:hypothetical protein